MNNLIWNDANVVLPSTDRQCIVIRRRLTGDGTVEYYRDTGNYYPRVKQWNLSSYTQVVAWFYIDDVPLSCSDKFKTTEVNKWLTS